MLAMIAQGSGRANTAIELLEADLKGPLDYTRTEEHWAPWPVADAMRIFRLRCESAERAGSDVVGLEESMRTMAGLPPDALVTVERLTFDDGETRRHHALIVSEARIVGCISVVTDASVARAHREDLLRRFERDMK